VFFLTIGAYHFTYCTGAKRREFSGMIPVITSNKLVIIIHMMLSYSHHGIPWG
jgi:hypothetical protein